MVDVADASPTPTSSGVPNGQHTDEEDGVDRLGHFGTPEPNALPPLGVAGPEALRQPVALIGLHKQAQSPYEVVLAGQEVLPARPRRGDGPRLEGGHLADGAGPQFVGAHVLAHQAMATAAWRAGVGGVVDEAGPLDRYAGSSAQPEAPHGPRLFTSASPPNASNRSPLQSQRRTPAPHLRAAKL